MADKGEVRKLPYDIVRNILSFNSVNDFHSLFSSCDFWRDAMLQDWSYIFKRLKNDEMFQVYGKSTLF